MELNPDFDGELADYTGKGAPKVEGGQVVEVGFYTRDVSDISPLRVLSGLKTLRCAITKGQGRVSDLTPLIGLPLTSLNINNNSVSDLSPLKAKSLTTLECSGIPASDLSPLSGLPLAKLTLQGVPVVDLTPLRGMVLTSLNINQTRVSDLSPLLECNSLLSLSATKLKLAPDDVAKLQAALPNCKIDWSEPSKTSSQPPASGTK